MHNPKPLVLLLCLEFHQGTFDKLNSPLLSALRAKADVQRVTSSSDILQRLSQNPAPKAVLAMDPAVTERRNSKVLKKLVQYVKSGGTIIFACQFSSFVVWSKMDTMFKKFWNLPWSYSTYHGDTFLLNKEIVGLDIQDLAPEYSTKAVHLKDVAMSATVYVPIVEDESADEYDDFDYPTVTKVSETPVAFTSVGKGRLGYVGDVNCEDGSTNLVVSMCLSALADSRSSSSHAAGSAGPSIGRRITPQKPVVLLLSLLKEPWTEDSYSQLYSGLRKNAIFHEAEDVRAANKLLSATPPPDAVLVTDAAIQEQKHSVLLTRLTEYMRSGGRVILGVQFSNGFQYNAAFFQRWGVTWNAGSYHRTTFVLNPSGVPAPLSAQALFPSYSMKTLHLKDVPQEAAVYVPTVRSHVESHVFAPAPITGAGLQEYPAVFARVGDGFLGYVGDVNGEQQTIRLLIEMCGVEVKPGDLDHQRFTRSVSFSPAGRMEPEIEEIPEMSLPIRRPREYEVNARAADRMIKREASRASAEKLKEEGNGFFKQDEYLKAAETYRAAAFLDGPHPVYMSNLAAALLKLEMWNPAESAATRALRYDAKHVKARYRRAVARKHLGEHDAALKDLHVILQMDPANASARAELSEVVTLRGGQAEDQTDYDINDGTSELAMGSESDDYQHEGNNIPCKFYNHDGCKRGDQCRYMHAPDTKSVRDELGRNVCAYWLIDSCRFDHCVYAHDRTYLPKEGWWNEDLRLDMLRQGYRHVAHESSFPAPRFEGLLVDSLAKSTWKHDLWAVVPYGQQVWLGAGEDNYDIW